MKKLEELKLLVVDDHVTERAHIKRVLKKIGCTHIDEAANALETDDRTNALQYDIIFLDWDMPGKSGIDILRKYRGNKKFDDTAFVMITAKSEVDDVIGALRAGATSYITKPADEKAITDNVTEVLEWLHTQQKLRR